MIQDQRHMFRRYRPTIADIEAGWQEARQQAVRTHKPLWEGRTDYLNTGERLDAYLNHSRWVADCPACQSGIPVWNGNPTAACIACGRLYDIRFPRADTLAKIEEIALLRPVQYRNWLPGETLDQLRAENIEHGLPTEAVV